MRIRQSVIVPVILALSVAGSILGGSAASAVGAQGTTPHVVAASQATWMHG